jgi:hypothetical protein
MKGHIRPRGENAWAIVLDIGRDPWDRPPTPEMVYRARAEERRTPRNGSAADRTGIRLLHRTVETTPPRLP